MKSHRNNAQETKTKIIKRSSKVNTANNSSENKKSSIHGIEALKGSIAPTRFRKRVKNKQ